MSGRRTPAQQPAVTDLNNVPIVSQKRPSNRQESLFREGMRALKYNSAGQFLRQVGTARSTAFLDDTVARNFSDATVDAAGNLWLTDESVHVAYQVDPAGTLLATLGSVWNEGSDAARFAMA